MENEEKLKSIVRNRVLYVLKIAQDLYSKKKKAI